MYCPHCKNSVLEPIELEKGLVAAGCPRCKGTLLSLINYRYWVDHWASSQQVDQGKPSREDHKCEESSGAKLCPKCKALMTKFQIGVETNNRIELCSHCDETWLDNGEWPLLRALDLEDKLPQIFTDAWQRNVRKGKQEALQEKNYVKLLGQEDFEKIKVFKDWLNDHDNASEIKQYLLMKA